MKISHYNPSKIAILSFGVKAIFVNKGVNMSLLNRKEVNRILQYSQFCYFLNEISSVSSDNFKCYLQIFSYI